LTTMPRRSSTPDRQVPYLPKKHIEEEAALLLAEYGNKHGQVTSPPIPIDDIVELYLELSLELKDMQELFGFADVHGALWVNERRVGIDESLDPDRWPAKLGRYHFTLAHEAGHWRLHRQIYMHRAGQRSLLPDGGERPGYICRSSEAKKPIEWQADFFAANLMMPREMINRSWHEWHGSMEQIALDDLRPKQREIVTAEVLRRGGTKSGDNAIEDMMLEHAARPLAERFQVSAEAMRIRLEQLKLLVRKRETTLFD